MYNCGPFFFLYLQATTKSTSKKTSKKAPHCNPTTSPTPSPSQASYFMYGQHQRCLEAGRLAPFDGLPSDIQTPNDCWTYCSLYGNEPVPFYFNWNDASNQCYCCGGVCTLVYDPSYDAYKVVQKGGNPTSFPTAKPTAPTSTPTDHPTKVKPRLSNRGRTTM